MRKIIIAIDGFSSTGKSTLAKKLAKKLSYLYIDTGAMYRAYTYFAIKEGFFNEEPWDKKGFLSSLEHIPINMIIDKDRKEIKIALKGVVINDKISDQDVSNKVSIIAKIPDLREKLLTIQQDFGKDKAVVVDGRDIGSVVFPKAELKLFLTALVEVRAKRRYEQFIRKKEKQGKEISFNEILENLKLRDKIDSTRKQAPLIKSKDAIEIDVTYLSFEELLEKIYLLSLEKIHEK